MTIQKLRLSVIMAFLQQDLMPRAPVPP